MALLKLAGIPNTVQNPCTRKATLTGVTYLKQNSYRTRYTGNKQYAVDIQGNLHTIAELRKLQKADKPAEKPKKKEARVETQAGNKFEIPCETEQISCFSASENNDLPKMAEEPQPTPRPARTYQVKKGVVRHRLLNYINSKAGKNLFFFTVTFPMGTADAAAYRIFNSWLTALRKERPTKDGKTYRMLRNYLWVAERQGEKSTIDNNTIHFHIAVPHFMNVQRANAMMRGTLKTAARRGEIPFSVYACKKYNGVDIAKDRKTKKVIDFAASKRGRRSLGNYLTKYVTKNDTKFEHLAWHNSRGFSSLFTGITFNKDEFQLHGLWKFLDFSKQFESEFAVFVPWKDGPPRAVMETINYPNNFIQSLN